MRRPFAPALATLCACVAIALAIPARAQAVSPIDYESQSLADVRLGIALATVAELADAPALLARPSSQRFVDDAFARLLASTDDAILRARVPRYREEFRANDAATFDRVRADLDLAALVHDVLHALPPPRDRLFAVGLLAEQTAYDARVLRSPSADAELRRALGVAGVADTLVPGLKNLRENVASIGRGRWTEIAAGAENIVSAILGSGTTPPFPENDGVWVVLLRSRPTAADVARRGTPHFWFDVVRFDGSHRTFGAYPAGDGNLGRNAPRLVCGFDREGDSASERAAPVVAPPGTTNAQLADELGARCIASAKGAWRYRVRDATDARFVVDLLVNTVADGATVMRELR